MRYTTDELENKMWGLIDGSLPEDEAIEINERILKDKSLKRKFDSLLELNGMLELSINMKSDPKLMENVMLQISEETSLISNSVKVMMVVFFLMIITGISGLFATDGSGFGLELEKSLQIDWNLDFLSALITPMVAYTALTFLAALIFVFFYDRRRMPI
jgi:hypothetical protein